MVSSIARPGRLTRFQKELLHAFFEREKRFFLTGGGALAGFYFGHRETEDLDFFSPPGPDLADAARAIEAAAVACRAQARALSTFPDFRRYHVRRAAEECIVDLVIDRAPSLESEKPVFGDVRVDTLRDIAANKICATLGRSQAKDLVDLEVLLGAGVDLERALDDAARKDAGVDPASLAWVLEQVTISPEARLPGGVDPVALESFRKDVVARLQRIAFDRARKR